jgi:hypothetical protein
MILEERETLCLTISITKGCPCGRGSPCLPDDPSTRSGICHKASPRAQSIDQVPDDYSAIHPAHIKNPAATRVFRDYITFIAGAF